MYDDLIHVKTKSGATIRREMSQTTVDVSEIRKEGYVLKESAIIRQYRKRWLVLTRTHLYSFKKDRSYTDPTEVVDLKACGTVKSADDITNRPYSFTVQVPERNFFFTCINDKERNDWVAAIGRATTESRRVRSYSEEIAYQEQLKSEQEAARRRKAFEDQASGAVGSIPAFGGFAAPTPGPGLQGGGSR